ncbi:LamG-like jellyroll fold domain-containing protein [Flavitalea sp. BT771]|nr:LamG-like jellyroll fold domain-containing protein [Flavitalea sp. BT771]
MLLMLVFGSLSLSAQTNRGLSFDSLSSDYASAGANTYIVPSIGFNATVEFWVYVPVAQAGLHYFVSQGPTGNAFYIGYDGDHSNHLLMGDTWLDSDVQLPIGQWNHIALAIDGNAFQGYLYLNGRMVDSTDFNYFNGSSGTPTQLGTSTDNTTYFTGKLDQLRIWDTIRTTAEIKAGMYGTVLPSTPHLFAYYKMDETSGAIAANSTATTGVDLTLNGSPTHPVIPIQTSNNALTFDVTNNTQVDMISDSANLTTGTVEAWLKPGSLSNESAFLANRGPGGSHFTMTLDNSFGNNRIGIHNTADGVHYIDYPAGFTANKWYHVALVTAPAASGDTTALYVNGNYITNTPYGYDNAVLNQPLHIGGNGVDFSQQWNGSIDEVRIWKVPLTGPQIATNIGNSLTGNETNLLSVWSFDQGIPDGDNTGLKVAVDNAPLTNNGTLSNFSLLSASASNFSLHNIVLPVTITRFTVAKQGNSALLQWQTAQEENTKDFIIQRSANGIDYTDIGSTPAAGNSHGLLTYAFLDNDPVEGRNYYRLKERDLDLTPTYSEVKVLSFTRTGHLIWYSTGARSVEVLLQKGSTELYSISNAAGNVIQAGRLSAGKTTLSQLPAGIYFVKVINTIGDELSTKILIP